MIGKPTVDRGYGAQGAHKVPGVLSSTLSGGPGSRGARRFLPIFCWDWHHPFDHAARSPRPQTRDGFDPLLNAPVCRDECIRLLAAGLLPFHVVPGRKLVSSEIAGNGGRLLQAMDGEFCGCSRPNNSNPPAPPTPLTSDLARAFVAGGFQATARTVSARTRARARNSRPITCRL